MVLVAPVIGLLLIPVDRTSHSYNSFTVGSILPVLTSTCLACSTRSSSNLSIIVGLIARGGDILESAADVELALLDKTGTLTTGNPTISSIIVVEGRPKRECSELLLDWRHARITLCKDNTTEAEKRTLIPIKMDSINDGEAGVSGKLDGKEVILGRADWVASEGAIIPESLVQALEKSRQAGMGSVCSQ